MDLTYNQWVSEVTAKEISAATRYCAVYGHPIRHSASPAMQNAGVAALGLDWRYLAFDVPPERLAAAISGAKAMNFLGLNLTVPHKLLAMELVDVLDESAREWGAVNTIRFEGRDKQGVWQPLRAWADPPGEVRSMGLTPTPMRWSRRWARIWVRGQAVPRFWSWALAARAARPP